MTLTPQARRLAPLILPALLVGVGSSLLLLALSWVSDRLQDVLWDRLPDAFGVSGTSAGWILGTLTSVGLVVGLVVWKVPGHAGPDPATTGLVDPPLPVRVLPGLALAVVIGLAGGVSLGPENPITAINIALAYALGMKAMPRTPAAVWVSLAAAGTVGALFGTPVAAALILSEIRADADPRPLWDRLFAPLVAAGAGSLTTVLIAHPAFQVDIAPYPGPQLIDVVSAMVISSGAALVGLVAVHAFPYVHRAFRRLGHPVMMLTAGGLVLGVLGAVGGHLTLFKGLTEMKELTGHADEHDAANLLLLALVKLAALVVAGSCGFRGGRIFPAVFVGVALGMLAHALVGSVPASLAITCAVLGILLATTRQGWLSLFTAAAVAMDLALLPLLCVAALPAWLLATGRPEMLIEEEGRTTGRAAA
ncbi:ion channel protein [Streptomyces sp. NBC_00237]|uniref:ion channel protein n=1 Tax=Streptomyces sp. NBC_00237 TaxID=2975687 RepID=UPI00224DD8DE|nr:ion channel protein [Streptomyces sp. NBC_00237]MCX5206644.1 ion channel protein [Streptomyces sp. NBC_00237]